jgi:nicotinamidase-related amidase
MISLINRGIGLMNTAVLVIDVQQGLCEGAGAAFDCAGIISRINAVTEKARSAGAPVLFIQHESQAGYLEHGSDAWQLANGLNAEAGDLRIRKTTPDSFLRTSLEEILRQCGIEKLVVCGMHSEFCVDTTTRKALALGFPVVLISDGHTSAGNTAISAQQVIAHHTATLTNISSFGPKASAILSSNVSFTVE